MIPLSNSKFALVFESFNKFWKSPLLAPKIAENSKNHQNWSARRAARSAASSRRAARSAASSRASCAQRSEQQELRERAARSAVSSRTARSAQRAARSAAQCLRAARVEVQCEQDPSGSYRPLYITSIWTCVHLGGPPQKGLNFAPIFSPVLSNTLDSISVAGFRLILTSLVFVPL